MRKAKTNYELSSSQVATPPHIVDLYWKVVRKHRPELSRVMDFGAGDGRFSVGGNYRHYIGVEIDRSTALSARLGANARIRVGCAFSETERNFDACIGNPPYVRHHDIESPWKEKTLAQLNEELDICIDGHANLFTYFIALGLIRTHRKGIVALVVPFEWASRPSAQAVREVIERNRWSVTIYRFEKPIFDKVLTTASISVIDKADTSAIWKYFDISANLEITERAGLTGNGRSVLQHADRSPVYARRGISPGSQSVFTLTESERLHHGLQISDVRPCVTTLRRVPDNIKTLSKETFRRHFVQSGRRCWLIKSTDETQISPRLQRYLDGIPEDARRTWTCLNQDPWYNYEKSTPPQLLYHSAFTRHAPSALINEIRAINVGSVYGVYAPKTVPLGRLLTYLSVCDVEAHVVAHAKTLRKLEVRQLNALLGDWWHVNAMH